MANGTGTGLRERIAGFWRSAGPRRWAVLVGILWAVLVLSYGASFLASASVARGTVALDLLYFLVTLILPLILIGVTAWLTEELVRQRALLAALADLVPPLIGGLEAARASLDRHAPASPEEVAQAVQAGLARSGQGAALERLLAGQVELLAGLRAPASTVSPEAARRPKPARPARAEPRAHEPPPLLPEADAERAPSGLDWPDLIRALDFPRDAEDREGFRALKAALRHHGLAQMLQAAEDVLNLLSSVGVYMEDLAPEPGDPAAWRRFIAGARGAELAGIGGIDDPQALERARELMRDDPIFRDTALYFQRRFDSVLTEFGDGAEDAQLLQIAATRSGRAFTLLARLGGAFG
ncbi:MAG: hypothetical protein U1E34_09435 [Amaricoccus sp.]